MTRLQKLLARSGLGSRRTIEDWIRAGRITIGGRIARLGDRAAPGDDVRLDAVKLELNLDNEASEVLLYYKPVGEVTTRSDPEGRPRVFARLPRPQRGRWIAVGRLDVNTAGLLLLTTDGELAHRLMHPSSEIEREYLVRVRGRPGAEVLRRLLRGVALEDGPARFDRIREAKVRDFGSGPRQRVHQRGATDADRSAGSHSTFHVVLHEGRNREVRRLWHAMGFEVSRLLRIRYGPAELPPEMRPGDVRPAPSALVARLVRAAGRRSVPATAKR